MKVLLTRAPNLRGYSSEIERYHKILDGLQYYSFYWQSPQLLLTTYIKSTFLSYQVKYIGNELRYIGNIDYSSPHMKINKLNQQSNVSSAMEI